MNVPVRHAVCMEHVLMELIATHVHVPLDTKE